MALGDSQSENAACGACGSKRLSGLHSSPSAATGRGGEAWGGVRHRGASVLVGGYNITGSDVSKAAPYLPLKGERGQEHGVKRPGGLST